MLNRKLKPPANEKAVEKRLSAEVKKVGGWSIKLIPDLVAGLPDRLCLFPGGRVVFVEVKSTGRKPSRIQKYIHAKLHDMGFRVEVIDKDEQINTLINGFNR